MRSRIDKEYDPNETQGINPHRRCVCANWNNDDGSCSYCEWNEEMELYDDDDNRDDE